MNRRTGAIHFEAPDYVPSLNAMAELDSIKFPASVDFQSAIKLGDPLGNDEFGNCVPSAQLRLEQIFAKVAMGSDWTPTREMSLDLYSADTDPPFAPNIPNTDRGTRTDVAMANWCSKGFRFDSQNEDVPVWIKGSPTNLTHLKAGIATLGGALLTLNLPQAAMMLNEWTLTPSSDPTTKPGSEAEHRVACGRFVSDGLFLITWGLQIFASLEFLNAYLIGVDFALSRRWMTTTGLAPSGLDYPKLLAAAKQFGNLA